MRVFLSSYRLYCSPVTDACGGCYVTRYGLVGGRDVSLPLSPTALTFPVRLTFPGHATAVVFPVVEVPIRVQPTTGLQRSDECIRVTGPFRQFRYFLVGEP